MIFILIIITNINLIHKIIKFINLVIKQFSLNQIIFFYHLLINTLFFHIYLHFNRVRIPFLPLFY